MKLYHGAGYCQAPDGHPVVFPCLSVALDRAQAEAGMRELVHLDTFSGVGMIALAAHAAGFTTQALCEIEPYPRHVLGYYWPEVPLYDDIRTLTGARLRADGLGRVDLLTGGVPCQPSSGAGKRLGSADDRWLWPDFLRLVGEVQPTWVVAENPAIPGLLTVESGRAFGTILNTLECLGYAWCRRWISFPCSRRRA